MWQDNDKRIMVILEDIELGKEGDFPVVCPICGKKEGHIYFHRWKMGEEGGGIWAWCSACCYSVHCSGRLPRWWKNLERINLEKLTSLPNYLEENKRYIDEWVNRIKTLQ